MPPKHRLAVIQRGVVREMARFDMEFSIDGEVVRGPAGTAVAVREHPGAGGHVDLGFVLRLGQAGGPVVWDCAPGLGRTEEEKLDNAVRMWAATTVPAVVELLKPGGEHADHYRYAELPGWHAIQGPASVFGFDHQGLADWLAGYQVLPRLAEAVRPALGAPGPHGVKLFLGGRAGEDVAEVRINGEVCEAASTALLALDWPRGERLCWARLFALLTMDGMPEPEPSSEVAEAQRRPQTAPASAPRRGLLARWRQARRARR